jgi:hypothetical protein
VKAKRKETTRKTCSWEDAIKVDVGEIGFGVGCGVDSASSGWGRWRALVNAGMNLGFLAAGS